MNDKYHEFSPVFEPALLITMAVGLAAVIVFAYLVVRIRPIDGRCTRYRSVGRKAARVSEPRRRCGAAPKDKPGLAIIMPSTSFDRKLGLFYSTVMALLVYYYHGAGIIQFLWNHNYGGEVYLMMNFVGIAISSAFVVWIVRFVQFVAAKNLLITTLREAGQKLPVYEEWGSYDRHCRKEFNSICRSLGIKERCALRAAVSDPEISEEAKRNRAESFVHAQKNMKERMKRVDFERTMDLYTEFSYGKICQ